MRLKVFIMILVLPSLFPRGWEEIWEIFKKWKQGKLVACRGALGHRPDWLCHFSSGSARAAGRRWHRSVTLEWLLCHSGVAVFCEVITSVPACSPHRRLPSSGSWSVPPGLLLLRSGPLSQRYLQINLVIPGLQGSCRRERHVLKIEARLWCRDAVL